MDPFLLKMTSGDNTSGVAGKWKPDEQAEHVRSVSLLPFRAHHGAAGPSFSIWGRDRSEVWREKQTEMTSNVIVSAENPMPKSTTRSIPGMQREDGPPVPWVYSL